MMTTPAKNASNKSGCSAHTWGQDMAATLHILQQEDERAFELYNNFEKKKNIKWFSSSAPGHLAECDVNISCHCLGLVEGFYLDEKFSDYNKNVEE